jgi:hypothetical protein
MHGAVPPLRLHGLGAQSSIGTILPLRLRLIQSMSCTPHAEVSSVLKNCFKELFLTAKIYPDSMLRILPSFCIMPNKSQLISACVPAGYQARFTSSLDSLASDR